MLAFLDPDPRGRVFEYIGLGYLLGTVFGQTTLAGAWAGFGPWPWLWRLALAPLWLFALWIGLIFNIAVHGGPGDGWFPLLMAGCMVGQWILVLLPFAGFSLTYSMRLTHRSDAPDLDYVGNPRQLQFGIRQLMILTAIVAVVLGGLRWLVLTLVANLGERGMGDAPIFIFLAVAAVTMTVPLVVALLLPRWWIAATAAVLALIALVTYWEYPLMSMLPRAAGPDTWHFVFINAFTTGWIVVVLGAMRLLGYDLTAVNLGMSRAASSPIPSTAASPFA